MFFNSPFESSLFVTLFNLHLENYNFVYNEFAYYLVLLNNNSFNLITICYLIPFYIIYWYKTSFNESFFFKNIFTPLYKACYGWTSSYVPYCKYFIYPFILYLFIFLLFSNLIGMIPFNFAITSHLSLTFFLAFTVWFSTVSLSFYYQGFAFLNHFIIRGIPKPLVPVLLMIELISYCIRAVSLSLRLFANIFSGHILLHVISSGLYEVLFSYCSGFVFSNFIAHLAGIVCFSILVIFEILVGLLQAYIFTLLSLIYLSDI